MYHASCIRDRPLHIPVEFYATQSINFIRHTRINRFIEKDCLA